MGITKHQYLIKLQENKMILYMTRSMANCQFLLKNWFKRLKKNFKLFKILKIYYRKNMKWLNFNKMKNRNQYIRNIQIDKQSKMKYKKCRLVKYLYLISKKFFLMQRETKYHNCLIQKQSTITQK